VLGAPFIGPEDGRGGGALSRPSNLQFWEGKGGLSGE
jgi:hypothetical protein